MVGSTVRTPIGLALLTCMGLAACDDMVTTRTAQFQLPLEDTGVVFMHALEWKWNQYEYFKIKSADGRESALKKLEVNEKPHRVGGSFYRMEIQGFYFFQYYYGCAILDTNAVIMTVDCTPCDKDWPMTYLGTLVISDTQKGPDMKFTTDTAAKLSKGYSCP